jgi:hypothetical protein
VLGGLSSRMSFNDMSDFSLEASDEGDSPRSYSGGHKGLYHCLAPQQAFSPVPPAPNSMAGYRLIAIEHILLLLLLPRDRAIMLADRNGQCAACCEHLLQHAETTQQLHQADAPPADQ